MPVEPVARGRAIVFNEAAGRVAHDGGRFAHLSVAEHQHARDRLA